MRWSFFFFFFVETHVVCLQAGCDENSIARVTDYSSMMPGVVYKLVPGIYVFLHTLVCFVFLLRCLFVRQ